MRPVSPISAQASSARCGVIGATSNARRDDDLDAVSTMSTLNDALDTMLTSSHGVVLVCGRDNAYEGAIRVDTIMAAMQEMQTATAAESAT